MLKAGSQALTPGTGRNIFLLHRHRAAQFNADQQRKTFFNKPVLHTISILATTQETTDP